MERVQRWTVNNSGLVTHKHLFDILKGIDDYGASVSQADLKD